MKIKLNLFCYFSIFIVYFVFFSILEINSIFSFDIKSSHISIFLGIIIASIVSNFNYEYYQRKYSICLALLFYLITAGAKIDVSIIFVIMTLSILFLYDIVFKILNDGRLQLNNGFEVFLFIFNLDYLQNYRSLIVMEHYKKAFQNSLKILGYFLIFSFFAIAFIIFMFFIGLVMPEENMKIFNSLLSHSGFSLDFLFKYPLNYSIKNGYEKYFEMTLNLQLVSISILLLTYFFPKLSEIKNVGRNKARILFILFSRKIFKLSLYFYIVVGILRISMIYMFASYADMEGKIVTDKSLISLYLLKYLIVHTFLFIILISFSRQKNRLKFKRNIKWQNVFMFIFIFITLSVVNNIVSKYGPYLSFVIVTVISFIVFIRILKMIKEFIDLNNENLYFIFLMQVYFIFFLNYFDEYETFKNYFFFIFALDFIMIKKFLKFDLKKINK